MLTRAPTKSYVCLQCQHKLAFRGVSKPSRNNVPTTFWRRWQSATAVAHRQETDDEGNESVVQYVTDPPTNDRKTTRYRHWQPPQTADLGISVLGKPAEILVLPQEGRRSRQRKARILAEGDAEEDAASTVESHTKPRLSVSEALAEERKPASLSEVTENIERLRKELEKPNGELRFDTRQKYEIALASGFSKAQLDRYIATKGMSANRHDRLQGPAKKALVAFILDRIWGLDRSTFDRDSMKPRAAYIPVSAEKYELLRMNGTYAACQSTFSDTTWRYDSQKARLWVYGKDADIKRVRNMFGPNNVIVTKTIALTPGLDRVLRTSNTGRSRFQETMRRYNVVAKDIKGSQKIQCWAFTETNLQRFERDIILWQAEKGVGASELPPLSLVALDHAPTMPVYHSSCEYHRYHLPINSGNDHISSAAVTQNGQKLNEVVRNLQEGLQNGKSTHSDYDVRSVGSSRSERFSSEYSVDLGQAVFRQYKPEEAHLGSPLQHTIPASFFLARAPLLPQFLAQQQPLETATSSAASEATTSDLDCQPFRIVLRPAKPNIHPSIEIHATSSPDPPLSLNIKRVALTFTQLSQMLLLPSTPIDLRVSRNDKYVLLDNGLPIEQRYAPLLAQIAEQLIRPDASPDEKRHAGERAMLGRSVSLLLDLDLSCFKFPSTEAAAVPQNQTQGKVRDFEENSGSEAKSKSRVKASKSTQFQVQYALECVETVEAAVYQVPRIAASAPITEGKVPRNHSYPRAAQPLLEHLLLTRIGSSQDRNLAEMVKVVEQPTLRNLSRTAASASEPFMGDNKTIGHDHERFQASIRLAYGIAMGLNRFITERTIMTVQARQGPSHECNLV